MKQVIQHLRSGTVQVEEVPAPALRAPGVIIATACSLISPGTERAAIELGRSSLLGKALRRPDQVRKVLDNFRREGFVQTLQKVQQKLDVTRALGYSCSGVVLESRDCEFTPGARVACAGTDAATHAEINFVPRNLCAAVPEGVSFDEAAFVALGGIALHAVHLAAPQIGEDAAVLGLGPVGLLLAQVLRAAGCRVAAFDLRPDRLAVAQSLGIERVDVSDWAALPEQLAGWNMQEGFDHVFIAAASQSTAPVEWAIEAAADRAKLIIVGDVRTDLNRAACYMKELTVMFARSYGPGRYDAEYEERGTDYPRAHVRWTLRRNLNAFLDLVARGQVKCAPLVTHRFPIVQAGGAYEVVGGAEPSLGVLLEYPSAPEHRSQTIELKAVPKRATGKIRMGFIGAGNYASTYLLPALKKDARVDLVTVATARGISAKKAAEEFGFARCTTNHDDVIADPATDAVFIATRHDLHARLAIAAIEAGKAVFVEKPLALSEEDVSRIEASYATNPVPIMVGHNRRFAPATKALRDFLGATRGSPAPLNIRYTVHAGPLPAGHWLHDPVQGGRILGECCHFVDWCLCIAGVPLEKLFATTQGEGANQNLHAVLHFANGSVATIVYDTGAHPSLPKETIEVACGGRSAHLENFSSAVFLDARGSRTSRFLAKGQCEMISAWMRALTGDASAIPIFVDWAASARASLKLMESAATGMPVWFESEELRK
jgi:polar amino acid transport system substrate-binding protein